MLLDAMRSGTAVDGAFLDRVVRARNREMRDGSRSVAKRRLMPYYLSQKRQRSPQWEAWAPSEEEDRALCALLQAKPRRTASGVTTVTVLTKPWPCAGDCLYCPSDISMPKSYLSDEPACQRALRCRFDPYLQVLRRLQVLDDMGHPTDKVELIVLGGSWTDYPKPYREWFVSSLFQALNDFGTEVAAERERIRWEIYESLDSYYKTSESKYIRDSTQDSVDCKLLSYNSALSICDNEAMVYKQAETRLVVESSIRSLFSTNEEAACRCVGLVMETRPDAVTPESLAEMRRLGCTKVQMGVQALRPQIRAGCGRSLDDGSVERSFELLRLFGFKIHVHLMANLPLSDPAGDMDDFRGLVDSGRYRPDEVKLYPCVLVRSARLTDWYEDGRWQPYDDDTLVDLLSEEVLAAPPYLRISRMIRDISAHDIEAGSRKTNLRQAVERRAVEKAQARGAKIEEVRMREVASGDVDWETLRLDDVAYDTTVSREHFLQWVDVGGRIAGFLRLSLPWPKVAGACGPPIPARPCQAMIRELHVYGRSTPLHGAGTSAQHRGLGAALVDAACGLAASEGYGSIAVISAVGTRSYYRSLGFADAGLYQVRPLEP